MELSRIEILAKACRTELRDGLQWEENRRRLDHEAIITEDVHKTWHIDNPHKARYAKVRKALQQEQDALK